MENLSWRLWFREAHLLPPDTSMSDLTDFTPHDTPLMSRRSSINGSYPAHRAQSFTSRQPSLAEQVHSGGMGTTSEASSFVHHQGHQNVLSDPEDGDGWSDEGEETVPQSFTSDTRRGRDEPLASAIHVASKRTSARIPDSTSSQVAFDNQGDGKGLPRPSTSSKSRRHRSDSPSAFVPSSASTRHSGGGTSVDRKRAVSSSSAFGSRARVKQYNMVVRRHPLSFQQAIESLLGPSDLALTNPAFSMNRSFSDTRDRSVAICQQNDDRNVASSSDQAFLLQNSAPAEFSRPSSPLLSAEVIRDTATNERRHASFAESHEDQQPSKGTSSKFFVAGASLDPSEPDSHNHGSMVSQGISYDEGSNAKQVSLPDKAESRNNALSEADRESSRLHQQKGRPHQHAHHSQNTHHYHVNHHSVHHNRTHGLTGTARSRSSVGLGKGRGHQKSNHSLIKLGQPTMSVNSQSPDQSHLISNLSEHCGDSSQGKEKPTSMPKGGASDAHSPQKGKQPVKFTMGSIEDDEEEDSDFENRHANSASPVKASSAQDEEEPNEDNSDEWSSDTTDSEEERSRRVKQTQLEERERLQAMFKKVPIRSASAADVRLLDKEPKDGENDTESSTPAVRGILSSIFHPEDTAMARRAHASAADLRANIPKSKPRKTSHDEPPAQLRKPHAVQVGSFSQSLNTSKSAVALPVLSTTGSRSTAHVKAKGENNFSVRDNDVFDESSDDEFDRSPHRAVDRLNQLAHARQKQKKSQRKGQAEKLDTKKRTSASSLEVQVTPELNEEEIRLQRRSSSPSHQSNAPVNINRSKSAVNVPDAGLPQSPRTTRRNMLRDELSESLRQNLLWERQSRHRMLGIAAPFAGKNGNTTLQSTHSRSTNNVADQQAGRTMSSASTGGIPRSQTVLGANVLRPLTSRNSSSGQSTREEHQYTGDFHHAGW